MLSPRMQQSYTLMHEHHTDMHEHHTDMHYIVPTCTNIMPSCILGVYIYKVLAVYALTTSKLSMMGL